MKNEFKILFFLSSIIVVFYIIFPDLENIETEKNSQSQAVQNKQAIENIAEEQNKTILLTFDIVRVSKFGDAVIAGKSEPNIFIELLNKNKKIASFYSDNNGEWIWVSEVPLLDEHVELRLRHIDDKKNNFFSDQTIVVLNERKKNVKPIIVKILSNENETIDILNLDYVSDGLSMDMVNFSNGNFFLSGRTISDQKLFFKRKTSHAKEFYSDEKGNWRISFNMKEISNDLIEIYTKIRDEDISLTFNVSEFNKKLTKSSNKIKNKKIIVEKGNSLWRIARKSYGNGIFYSEIYKNNLKKIKHPDLIFPGQVFNIPVLNKKISYE